MSRKGLGPRERAGVLALVAVAAAIAFGALFIRNSQSDSSQTVQTIILSGDSVAPEGDGGDNHGRHGKKKSGTRKRRRSNSSSRKSSRKQSVPVSPRNFLDEEIPTTFTIDTMPVSPESD